jgi:hypothetical protein
MIPVIIIATTWTKHVANAMGEKKGRPVKTKVPSDRKKELTRLEDEGTSDIHVPTIARWFDTLIGAQ